MASLAPAEKAPAGKPLKVGSPHDPAEREADRIADILTAPEEPAMPVCAACAAGGGAPCPACGGGGGEVLRRQVLGGGDGGSGGEMVAPPSVHRVLSEPGEPLGSSTRAFFEPRFGRDLSSVQVHTGNSAAESTRAIQARAFTTGQDIVFAPGEYDPESHDNRKLLAHELAHVNQYEPEVRRDVTNPPAVVAPPGSSTLKAAREVILDALEGYTSRTDSENIMNQFRDKNGAMVLAIVNEVMNYGALKHSKTPNQIFEWLLDDLTEENRRELRKLLVLSGSINAQRIVAGEIKDCLDGYTSEDDSAQVYALLQASSGLSMDSLLVELESLMQQAREDMCSQVFGDLDRVTAEKVRQLFFKQGGPIAAGQYAAPWTARKIMNLLEGYTSHSDSTDIVWLLNTTQPEMRGLVQVRLEELCQAGREKSVSVVLMHDMDKSDYERLRAMGGLDLLPYNDTKNWAEKTVSAVEWVGTVAQWAVCGIVGLLTGIFAAAWGLIKSVKDIVVAVWDLIWSLVYLVSNGAAGSENWLRVKTFFISIGDLFSDPGKAWDSYWEETKLEFNTIQGPLSDCRVAELFVRKFVVMVVNILLIFLAGYGVAKGAVAGARVVAEGATLADVIGVRGVISMAGKLATRRISRFVAAGAEAGAKLLEAIRKPSSLLRAVSNRLRTVVIAADDAGYWRYLRKQGGTAVQAASDATSEWLTGERRFWDENRKYWRDRAAAQQTREQILAPEFDAIEERAKVNERPDPPMVVDELVDEVQQLDKESSQLHTEVTGKGDTVTMPEDKAGTSDSSGKTAQPHPPQPPPPVAPPTADINALIEEALGDLKSEPPAPLNPDDFGPKPRRVVLNLREIELAEIPAERRGYYDASYPGYVQRRQAEIAAGIRPNRPILSPEDYSRFRWGKQQNILVQSPSGSAVDLSKRGVIEQLAGHVLEKVVDARLPGSSNTTSFPNPFGKQCIPDNLPLGKNVVFLDPSGYKANRGVRFSARFVGDSKYKTYINSTEQTRGFVNLARFSDESMLVFYMRWQEGFPAIEGLAFDDSLGGRVLPVRPWNEQLVSPELRALARDRGVKIRIVTDPIWK